MEAKIAIEFENGLCIKAIDKATINTDKNGDYVITSDMGLKLVISESVWAHMGMDSLRKSI